MIWSLIVEYFNITMQLQGHKNRQLHGIIMNYYKLLYIKLKIIYMIFLANLIKILVFKIKITNNVVKIQHMNLVSQ